MDLLVLGGTRFVGRAVIDDALARGWAVTALNRGVTGALPGDVETIVVDRTDDAALAAAVDGRRWDLVVDTWSGAPQVVTRAAAALAGAVGRWGYVSSCSVYEWGSHIDESSPLVVGDADAADGEYPALKRGAELGLLSSFPDALLARAGLILGPHEDIGRLPWWLTRIARGGPFTAPGRPQRALRYIDARDLAAWLLSALEFGRQGAVDVIGPRGFATTADLMQACIEVTGSDGRPVWLDEAALEAAGVQPWTQLPCWVPEVGEFAGFLESDTSLAEALGLRVRPLRDTVADTWAWLQRDGAPPVRVDRGPQGLPPELERQLLDAAQG